MHQDPQVYAAYSHRADIYPQHCKEGAIAHAYCLIWRENPVFIAEIPQHVTKRSDKLAAVNKLE